MKRFFYLLLFSVVLTACNEDEKATIPTETVTNLSFTDADLDPNKISGPLTWELPVSEQYITGYVIYTGSTNTEKGTKIGEVSKGTTIFNVPTGTANANFLLVVAKNELGESTNVASASVIPLKSAGLYVLNCGNSGDNNASLSYYDYASGKLTSGLYLSANGSGLGDGAEQLVIYGSKMYVTVTASNRIVVLDTNAKVLKTIEPKADGSPMGPRAMAVNNGKVYVTYFDGHAVAVLDTTSLTVEKTVAVGRYPEQIAVANGKLYVANSGGLDFPNYGKTVSVINESTFALDKTIDVALNPVYVRADSQGDIYVISMGNYGAVKNTLQRIDATTNAVTVIDNASRMTLVNDKLYTIYAQWGAPEMQFKVYDVLTETYVNTNFITDGTKISTPEALAVDPITGKIAITDSPWGSTSSLLIFSPEGKLEGKAIDTGGYYAKWITFNTK